MLNKRTQNAFSLIELMVVIAIIGIIASIGLASITAVQKTSRDAQRQADLRMMQGVLQQYYADKNKYPSELPEMGTGNPITDCSGAATPCTVTKTYLSKTPKDPTGTLYLYRPYTDIPANTCGIVGEADPYTCHKYYLCATLEGLAVGSNLCFVAGTYNYQLTQP